MKSLRLVAAALVVVTITSPAFAQPPKPDFSGRWVEDEAQRQTTFPTPSAGGARPIPGPPPDTVITQTPASVTIEQSVMRHVIRYAYKLDGNESVNHNGANTMTTKSTWDARTLLTQGTSFSVTSQGESSWDYTERRSLDAKGVMTVETRYRDEAGKVNVTTRVFHRQPAGR